MAVQLGSVFETLMYEYAKLIADRVVHKRADLVPAERVGGKYWGFVARTFKKLSCGEIAASAILRENKLLVVQGQQCAYCGEPLAKVALREGFFAAGGKGGGGGRPFLA